jgi:hypothetical protein
MWKAFFDGLAKATQVITLGKPLSKPSKTLFIKHTTYSKYV